MRRRAEDDDVTIFNFSFLDILSCTIGALVFILLLFVISSADLVEGSLLGILEENLDRATADLNEVNSQLTERRQLLETLQSEVGELEQQVRESDQIIGRLTTMLQSESHLDAVAIESLLEGRTPAATNNVDQRRDWSSDLMPNLEQRAIYWTQRDIYIQSIGHTIGQAAVEADPVLQSFLSHSDPVNTKLLVIPLEPPTASFARLVERVSGSSARLGEGLRSRPAPSPPSLESGGDFLLADENGDGLEEVRYEDFDGDGNTDVKRLDVDGDGLYETRLSDFDSTSNRWLRKVVDINLDGLPDGLYVDTDPRNETFERRLVGINMSTGIARTEYRDENADGIWDTKLVDVDLADGDYEERYTDFDSPSNRWKAKTEDTTRDGVADVLWVDTDTGNDFWEEKYVDQNGDGVWDIRFQDVRAGDGDWEIKFSRFDRGAGVWMELAVDSDNNGVWDTWFEHTNPTDSEFAIKRIDTDGDGLPDQTLRWDPGRRAYVGSGLD